MSPDISAVGMFCEDIREEKAGTDTLIGILPDNMTVPQPGSIPKLCLYVRIQFEPKVDPGDIVIRVFLPTGENIMENIIEPELIKGARDKAISRDAPLVGLFSRMTWGNFPAQSSGRVKVSISAGGREWICGHLNIKVAPPEAISPGNCAPPSPDGTAAKSS